MEIRIAHAPENPSNAELRFLHARYVARKAAAAARHQDTFLIDCTLMDQEGEMSARGMAFKSAVSL